MSNFTWATVTAVGPLRITLDGDAVALGFTPDSLVDPASLMVDGRVRCELTANNRVIVHGSASDSHYTRADVDARQVPNRNRVINGAGRVNQRAAASGASLASGAYFLDNWLSGSASNAVTWTGDEQGRVMTVPASKSIKTPIEKRDMPAGDYTLSQAGTAQGRVYNVGATPPAYAALPLTVTLDGTADVVVEFGPGTVSNVQLELGTFATPFERESFSALLAKCQRYYTRLSWTVYDKAVASGLQPTTTSWRAPVVLPVTLRATPTVVFSSIDWTDLTAFGTAATLTDSAVIGNVVYLAGTMAANGAGLRPGFLRSGSASSYIEFKADIL